MKELMSLISILRNDNNGKFEHRSSCDYYEGNGSNTIYFYENQDDEERYFTTTPLEYWEELKNNPIILDALDTNDLKWLKKIIGDNKGIAIYQTELVLSNSEIAFYFIYNFKKLRADLNIDKMNVKVYEKLKDGEKEYLMPFDDFITLNSIVRDKVNEMDLELQKCQCKCGHTFYVDGNFNPLYDKCIYCQSGDDVVVVNDYVLVHKAS